MAAGHVSKNVIFVSLLSSSNNNSFIICIVFFPGEVIVPVSFQFVINANFSTDLLNRSASRFVALEENIRQAVRRVLFVS